MKYELFYIKKEDKIGRSWYDEALDKSLEGVIAEKNNNICESESYEPLTITSNTKSDAKANINDTTGPIYLEDLGIGEYLGNGEDGYEWEFKDNESENKNNE